MSSSAILYVGADVSQDTIAFCDPKVATVKNQSAALLAYLATLPAAAHLICEATGRHQHALQRSCAARGMALSTLNPAHARAYAKSLGKLEKTDALDARLLRRYGEERRPPADPLPDPLRQQLLDLLMVRTALVQDIADHRRRNRLLAPVAHQQLHALIGVLQNRQRVLERRLADWLDEAPADWRDRVQTLCLVTGVGVLSALHLVAYLPELGRCNRRQIAKLAGLAPLPWDSGQWHGVRRIQHGRAPVRRVLYLCAVVAARWNPVLRPHYLQLRARGLPAKPAFCAIARKLLVFLNSVLHEPGSTAAA